MGKIVFLLALSLFFFNIDSFPLRNWDEAWYAEIIKNMASGNYSFLVPFWNGQYYFDKPPLYFWLSLPIVKIFGIGEWQVRFVSVLAASCGTFLIYLIGKKLFNQKVGIFSSIVFVTLGQVYVRFSHGNLDALLIFLNLAVFYFYLLSYESKKLAPVVGVLLGLGLLTKGWLLGLFPLFVIFFYEGMRYRRFPTSLFIILPFAFVSYIWWPILGFKEFGREFVAWYIFHPLEDSVSNTFTSFSLKPFEYFLRDIGVWSVPFFMGVVWFLKIDRIDRNVPMSFLIPSFLFLFGIGFLTEKLDWHNLPAYPWISIIIGCITARVMLLKKTTLFIFAIMLFVQVYVVYRIENIYPDRSEVGAHLGILAKKIIPRGDSVILDDHDFTSFLFYSDVGQVYVIEPHPTKPREWWTLQKTELLDFVKNHPKTWVITKDINSLPFMFGDIQIKENYLGYKFLKLK